MPFDEKTWEKTRATACKGSGVAKAIGEWKKVCKEPKDLKEPADLNKAGTAAKTFLTSLKTAEGKCNGKKDEKIPATLKLIAAWRKEAEGYLDDLEKENNKRLVAAVQAEKRVHDYLKERKDFVAELTTGVNNYKAEKEKVKVKVQVVEFQAKKVAATQERDAAEKFAAAAETAADEADKLASNLEAAFEKFKKERFDRHRAESAIRGEFGVTSEDLNGRDKFFPTMSSLLAAMGKEVIATRRYADQARLAAEDAAARLLSGEQKVARLAKVVGGIRPRMEKIASAYRDVVSLSGMNAKPPAEDLSELKAIKKPEELAASKANRLKGAQAKQNKVPDTEAKLRVLYKAAEETLKNLLKTVPAEIRSDPAVANDFLAIQRAMSEVVRLKSEVDVRLPAYKRELEELIAFCES